MRRPDAVVVIPARDEARRIGACLRALAAQRLPEGVAFTTILVLDRCADDTADVARASRLEDLVVVEAPPPGGVGCARRFGMERAAALLADDGLIACTDADTEPAPDWLATQLALVAAGAEAVGGVIELAEHDLDGLPPEALERREARAAERFARVRTADPSAEHHFFSGASMAVTAGVYRAVGGLEPRSALEDEAFERRLVTSGVRIARSAAVRVRTSARTTGRAPRGLARDLELGGWLARNRFEGKDYTLARALAARRASDTTISVVIPARECGATVGGVVRMTCGLALDAGLVDEVVVIDGNSRDDTRACAAAAGARVVEQDALLPEHGPALGKGDAMWRALAATTGDVVAFLDADTADPDPVHLLGILGPLLEDQALQFVKGTFARPFLDGDGALRDHEGGRVTELMARPLLNLHVPQLAGFEQPLAGEFAARRALLEALPFPAGYGVEIALLIDALRAAGLGALAESRLGTRQNAHQPLRELGAMAYAVLCAVEARIGDGRAVGAGLVQPWAGGAVRDVPLVERPPLAQLAGAVRNAGTAGALS
ncbi:glucosyl-3-phosphoglycerate synthase [Conexibacter woesei]|uniref:glucosyl-3-phosphoglycerate synthase n=1 Tax=Conexibacter woesei TaxID=191495 RepID=UPI0003FA7713|nr:glucosyl-3-phosphoglycerate synthase [Conexibacter woesei]